jgi:hypothetical protein
MAKFRTRLKIQGFELEVDGEREDIPAITSALNQQLAGFIQPAEMIVDPSQRIAATPKMLQGETQPPAAKLAKKRPNGSKSSNAGTPTQAVEFRHEPATYGSPSRAWPVIDKSIWLLSVIKGITGTKEVSGPPGLGNVQATAQQP